MGKGDPHPVKESEDVDISNRVVMTESLKTLGLMLLLSVPPLILIRMAYSVDALEPFFYPVQVVETTGAFLLVRAFGVDVSLVHGATQLDFNIPGVTRDDFRVIPACTALMEIGFWMGLAMGYRSTGLRIRALWAVGGGAFLFLENIVRIAANYPIMLYGGAENWNSYHMFWIEWGQLGVVALMFITFAFVTRGGMERRFREGERKGHGSDEEDISTRKEGSDV